MTESWRNIGDYPGYEVSDLGRVRSVGRVVSSSNRWGAFDRLVRPRILKAFRAGDYLAVQLGAKSQKLYVHRLVAAEFSGKADGKHVVNHLDGNRHNNAAANLEWCTRSENMLHSTHILGNKRGQWASGGFRIG